MLERKWPYPTLFVHRLGGAHAPENTLAGLRLSAQLGAKAVECDVKLTKDNHVLLLHDETIDRTTNGSGLARCLTLEELHAYDAGVKFHPAFRGERLPTLLDLAKLAQGACLSVNLEIKPCPGREEQTGHLVAKAASELWNAHKNLPLLSSFSIPALLAAKKAAPHLPRALLVHSLPGLWQEFIQLTGATALHIDYACVTPDLVSASHAMGLVVLAYTVNHRETARLLLSMGVDMICSDRPDQLLALLK